MKVLIIRFSSIGDIVLTTPVIRCVKRQTGAEVHFLTKQGFAPLLRANPYVDRLWTIQKNVSSVAAALAAEGFDHVIDLHRNLRTLELRTRLMVHPYATSPLKQLTSHLRPRPRWHAFKKLNAEKFLLVRFGVNRLPDEHIVDRYLDAAHPLGVVNDGAGLDYFIAPEEAINREAEGLPTNYLAFVIGAAHNTKRLTEAQMIAVCAAFPYPILLLGGPAERAQGDRIAAGQAHVTNVCGRFSLNGSADLVRKAAAVVTHDTGMMHIAAAFRKPILSVWGNTVPAFGMYPYLPGEEGQEEQRRQEVLGLPCRPCSKIGHESCPQGHFRCIKEQDPTTIAARALLLYNNAISALQ